MTPYVTFIPRLVAFTGKRGHGKTTAARELMVRGYEHICFADPLREVATRVYGVTAEEMADPVLKETVLRRWPFKSPRDILQRIGTDMFRSYVENTWVMAFKLACDKAAGVVCSDLRFPNEADHVRSEGGLIIKVVDPRKDRDDAASQHASELAIDQIVPDVLLLNDGSIDDLNAKVSAILAQATARGSPREAPHRRPRRRPLDAVAPRADDRAGPARRHRPDDRALPGDRAGRRAQRRPRVRRALRGVGRGLGRTEGAVDALLGAPRVNLFEAVLRARPRTLRRGLVILVTIPLSLLLLVATYAVVLPIALLGATIQAAQSFVAAFLLFVRTDLPHSLWRLWALSWAYPGKTQA